IDTTLGSVTISNNSISNVSGNGTADGDDAKSAGDGIRTSFVDGHVAVASNSIVNTGDDGIEVFRTSLTVSVLNNTLTSMGNGAGNGGDGIVVSVTGVNAISTITNLGAVTVSGNIVNGVIGTAAVDLDDGRTSGDGIRVSFVDGDVRILTNTIANLVGGGIYNDGIQ